MAFTIIVFLFGSLVGFILSLIVLFRYTKSIKNFTTDLIRAMRKDNAKYMAHSLENFKDELAEEIMIAQEKLQSDLLEDEDVQEYKKNSGNNGGLLN